MVTGKSLGKPFSVNFKTLETQWAVDLWLAVDSSNFFDRTCKKRNNDTGNRQESQQETKHPIASSDAKM